MASDERIDAYIDKAADFAKPILRHIRAVITRALPGAVETIKWGMPHWMVSGKNVAGMAAFKAHCAMVIHGDGRQGDAMGQYGKIAALADLPLENELSAKLREAAARVVGTVSATTKPQVRGARAEIAVPDDLVAALGANPAAKATFDAFAPSHRRDYLEWITEAKRDETRAKRVAQTVEWLAEGKKRNWKYENC